jgi:D-Tyr-tRNAtyr deacylase
MRLVVQRVKSASVKALPIGADELDEQAWRLTGSVSNGGLLVLVGLHYKQDDVEMCEFQHRASQLARKLSRLKFFPNGQSTSPTPSSSQSPPTSFSSDPTSSPYSSESPSSTPRPVVGGGARWKSSLQDNSTLSLLLVSQFTLFSEHDKGGKLDFHRALPGPQARERFDCFVQCCRAVLGAHRVAIGSFGELMRIDACLDGPVTVLIDQPDSNISEAKPP